MAKFQKSFRYYVFQKNNDRSKISFSVTATTGAVTMCESRRNTRNRPCAFLSDACVHNVLVMAGWIGRHTHGAVTEDIRR